MQNYKNICLTEPYIIHKGSVSIKKVSGLNQYLLDRNRVSFIKRISKSRLKSWLCYKFLCLHVLIKDPKNINRISYLNDGWYGKVDLQKYPFIIIKDDISYEKE
jgi:hypothetical protein